MKRPRSHEDLVESIKTVVAGYPNAPDDLVSYDWFAVPRYWTSFTVPRGARIEPRHEDRHAGVSFRVGWSVPDRAAALWIL
jgi:hypothetical protein